MEHQQEEFVTLTILQSKRINGSSLSICQGSDSKWKNLGKVAYLSFVSICYLSVLIRVHLYPVNSSLHGSCLIYYFLSGLAELKHYLWRLKIVSGTEMREFPKVYLQISTLQHHYTLN